MTEIAAFDAVFVTCRQVRDEVHFIFSVPSEKGTQYLERIGGFPRPGESRWCAIARMKPLSEDKAEREPSPHETVLDKPLENGPVPAGVHNPYSRRAGILAADALFQRWIGAPTSDPGSFAASYIRRECKVSSRKDILPGTTAALRFDLLQSAFVVWREGPKHGAA